MKSYVYTKCRHCCDWNYQATKNHLCQPLPADYPNRQHKNSPRPPVHCGIKYTKTIKPIQQTNETLITASQFCAYNYWHNVWSKKCWCIYEKCWYIIHLLQNTYYLFWHFFITKNVDVKETLKLLHLPTAWTAPINLNQYIYTPMHLIF